MLAQGSLGLAVGSCGCHSPLDLSRLVETGDVPPNTGSGLPVSGGHPGFHLSQGAGIPSTGWKEFSTEFKDLP